MQIAKFAEISEAKVVTWVGGPDVLLTPNYLPIHTAPCHNSHVTPMNNFPRITVDPAQMGGVPCVRHLRIPVATVLRMLAAGRTEEQILSEYPDLESEDVRECLRYAAAAAQARELPLPQSA